jgi:hypothetical protein
MCRLILLSKYPKKEGMESPIPIVIFPPRTRTEPEWFYLPFHKAIFSPLATFHTAMGTPILDSVPLSPPGKGVGSAVFALKGELY